ncbi:RNA-binding region-containing protein 3 isoform X2 [Diachasma alloeum]|uniref:RNA-binding region-containing protein 3 isoform X2 n=1 Tax=Diachasma alloeum TaxID=454923 RepID=UPI0007382D9E|nr:RNA-binding region-containing protein 3 isoform X2 [Diachasma alloeum]
MSSSTGCDTLRVLHLPPYITDEKRDELFKKYGALHTKTIRKSDNYSATFVKFPSNEAATKAFLQLHQLEVKGQHLSIEFAKKSMESELDGETGHSDGIHGGEAGDTGNSEHFQAFIKKLNSWTTNYTFSQPPPPNISYKYPLPTRNTLMRIAIQLIREPAFYTQVLHLMNKMNLPPPFEELDEEFPTLREVYDVENYRDIFGRMSTETEDINDEEESEMESDDDKSKPEMIPVKRQLPQSRKRLKIPKFVNPLSQPTPTTSSHKTMRPEDVFESMKLGDAKNLKIDLKNVEKLVDPESNRADSSVSNDETGETGFGLIFPANVHDGEEEEEEKREFITSEELAANRISANDQRLLPVYQNYHPGKASCRLYIKNLSKHVEVDDLHYIYKRYVLPGLNNSESQYDVRLMQEGRMKGQAFVTFQNMGQAQLALNETNGYILKDKPMVVQFAKAAKS